MRRRTAAFTLIEILVVISILAVLMGLGVGLIQRAGTGNLLTQCTNAVANLLATARASAFGAASAYVTVDTQIEGGGTLRVFRNRPVLTWHCENFEDASEIGLLKQEGGVEVIANGAVPSLSGKHIHFDGNGRVIVSDRPWQQFVDGFSLECRVNVAINSTKQKMLLFKKGAALEVSIVAASPGRYGVEAKIRLAPDENSEGAGQYVLRTGERGPEPVVEWEGPMLAGRWHDLRVSYDRNEFLIQVDGSTRGIRTGKRNRMRPAVGDAKADFVIGSGFQGDFDSLQMGGIYEDDDDRFEISEIVYRIDPDGQPIGGRLAIHFRNQQLDPHQHTEQIEMRFRLGLDEEGEYAPTRRIVVGLSGETFVRRPGE